MEWIPDLLVVEHVTGLAEELRDLLQKYFPEDHMIAAPHMERAKLIRAEIESLGFMVTWRADLDPQTFDLSVVVDLHRPKSWLATDDQKMYDEWLTNARARFVELKQNPSL